jgi:hypothetical protein
MMKIKKKKSAILVISTLVILFGLDLSINAKDLNLFQDATTSNPLDLFNLAVVPSFLYLFSIGIIGLDVIGRGGTTHKSSAEDRSPLLDKADRRFNVERRRYDYDYIVPDRRTTKDRREHSEKGEDLVLDMRI